MSKPLQVVVEQPKLTICTIGGVMYVPASEAWELAIRYLEAAKTLQAIRIYTDNLK